ncbi:MAG: dethiobiotin synthase, partial [Candidatus Dadabacteria bacterium]
YALRLPAAPLVAAEAAGIRIDPLRLAEDFERLAAAHDLVVVEGAGGLLVPIAPNFTYRDLARRLSLPVIVVVGSRLGCVNHALLTLEAIERERLRAHGYIVNCLEKGERAKTEAAANARLIARFTTQRSLGSFPFAEKKELASNERLAELAERHLEVGAIV